MGTISDIGMQSGVTGLREIDSTMDDRFLRFFSIVQDAASRMGRVFFLDCGEDHDLITDEIDCEDLSGWLVREEDVGEFEPAWAELRWGDIPDRFTADMVVARWSGTCPEDITVSFDFYNSWMGEGREKEGVQS